MKTVVSMIMLGSATLAVAEPRLEVGAAIGGHAFSANGELGVDDEMAQPGPVSNIALGARAAYAVLPRLAVEAEAMAIPTHDNDKGATAIALGMRAHARFDVLRGRLRPFVVGGVGIHALHTSSPNMHGDADQSFHWGGGVRWALNSTLDVRVDARHLIVPDRTLDGATSDFELTAGVSYRFGAKPRPKVRSALALPPPATPRIDAPPPELDRDLDTIPDAIDACPTESEDIDSYEDTDGCPELDNDHDGIRDDDDTCPTDAETKNGFNDEDGCPDQVINELAGIAFEPNSARLEPAATRELDRAVQRLTDYPGLFVEIGGHTSADERNPDLAVQRAEAVKAALVKRGIATSRILTVGHGAEKPVGNNKTDEGRRKNRRIEFRVMTPDEALLNMPAPAKP